MNEAKDIALERALVEGQAVNHGSENDDVAPAEEHRQAQQSGEVFASGHRGDGL